MIRSKTTILLALILPIFFLAALTGYKKTILSVGTEITLPIRGYDPRDLLSGHYLIYTIDYGVSHVCKTNHRRNRRPGYMCLNPKKFSYTKPSNCSLMIKGACRGTRFEAGIERYFIPEKEALRLEKLVQSKQASVVLSILRNGKAQIKSLLIDGKDWKTL